MTANTQTSPGGDTHCSSCGRFVGPYETCPYCGAKQRGRISVRAVKIAAVVLATVGLLALWWAARTTDIPTVSAADAQGTMNMAYVKISGHIARSLSYDPESGYLAFWVDDGTGEVRVSSYRDVTESLLASGTIPALGDAVTVAGTLRIREDYVALTLNVPEHLTLTRPDPVALKSNELTVLDEGLRVRMAGEVSHVLIPYPGLTLITLRDDSGETVIAVGEVITALTGALPSVVEGQGIAVTGTVSLYKDTPQIVPASVGDIALSEAPAAPTVEMRDLKSLSTDDEGKLVQVQGHVVLMEGFKGSLKATLDDTKDQLVVLLWDSVYAGLADPTALDLGAEITVRGEIQVYQGELELVPETAGDITLDTPAPEIAWVEIKTLKTGDAGRIVRLRGVLGKPDGFSAGVKVMLDDGTGEITVLLWNNLVTALERRPAEGMTVEIVGLIEEYQGELEIIPRSVYDWRVSE
ncbi:MAG: OB-fold nucleic acid binding domain-containing protein [Anaerolineae bacterium]|nr:OB-fold nucleic acid binding domain-containing protein [Anaerolineae bacterium]